MTETSFSNAPKFEAKKETVSTPPNTEKGMMHETEQDKARRLIISLAVDTNAKSKTATPEEKTGSNAAERGFGILGEAMQAPKFGNVEDIDVAEPTLDFVAQDREHKRFDTTDARPRFKVVNGDAVPTYDKRLGGLSSETPSNIQKDEYEIQAVTARVQGADGTTWYCCVAETTGNQKTQVMIDEQTFIDSYILAQHTQIQRGITEAATVNPRLAEAGIQEVVRTITTNYADHALSPDPSNHTLEPAKGVDIAKLETEADKKLRPTGDQIKSLATRMKKYVDADTTRTADSAAIEKYITAIKAGEHPGPEAILQILKIAGEPKLNDRVTKIEEEIQKIDGALKVPNLTPERERELKMEKDQLKKERLLVKNILSGTGANNTVFELFRDMQDGKVSTELVELLEGKLDSITDPMAFFELKADDLEDKNSLASIIFKHFANSRGLTDGEMAEKVAWLSKFFKEHGSDIAMMGIFALFQMMSTMIGDAVKGAN